MAKKKKAKGPYKNKGRWEIEKHGLTARHCGICKTNYWRHKTANKPEVCGVCLNHTKLNQGHVRPVAVKRQLKRDRH